MDVTDPETQNFVCRSHHDRYFIHLIRSVSVHFLLQPCVVAAVCNHAVNTSSCPNIVVWQSYDTSSYTCTVVSRTTVNCFPRSIIQFSYNSLVLGLRNHFHTLPGMFRCPHTFGHSELWSKRTHVSCLSELALEEICRSEGDDTDDMDTDTGSWLAADIDPTADQWADTKDFLLTVDWIFQRLKWTSERNEGFEKSQRSNSAVCEI